MNFDSFYSLFTWLWTKINKLRSLDEESLYEASAKGDLQAINDLLKNYQNDIPISSINLKNPLEAAIKNNQPSALKLLWSRGFRIDAQKLPELLIRMSASAYDECLEFILQNESNLDASTLIVALEIALINHNTNTVLILLDHNAYPTDDADQDLSLILYCLKRLKTRDFLLKKLIKKTPDVNFSSVEQEESLLTKAVLAKRRRIVKILLKKGARVNVRSKNGGYTALHEATCIGDVKIMQLLLDYGADPNLTCRNSEGVFTPLRIACQGRSTRAIDVLLKNGAGDSEECLRMVTENYWKYRNLDVLKRLLKNGTDPNAAMFSACGNPKVLNLLIRYGAKSDTILHKAIEDGHYESVKILLKHNADPTIKDETGKTAIHCAACNANPAFLELVLKNTFNLDLNKLVDNEGKTPLHYVGGLNNLIFDPYRCKRFNLLLHHGASLMVKNSAGLLPSFVHCRLDNVQFCPVVTYFNKVLLLGYKVEDASLQEVLKKKFRNENLETLAEYEEEIQDLAETVIDDSPRTSLYDLLLLRRYELLKYSGNANLLILFNACRQDLERVFPHYGLMLNRIVCRNLARKKWTEEAIEKFEGALGCRLPKDCNERIFAFFNESQLKDYVKQDE